MTPESQPEIPERKHDLFQDPALARSLEEDPVASFIVSHWKNLVVVILAVIGFFFLRAQLISTSEVRVAEASELFERARDSVTLLLEQQGKATTAQPTAEGTAVPGADDKAKAFRAAKDSLASLKSGPEPYAALAHFYDALIVEEGVSEKVRLDLMRTTVQTAAWRETTALEKRLVSELQYVAAARGLLDFEETFSQGVAALILLGQESSYVRPVAVLSLLRVAKSPEDKSSALILAQDIMKAYPEQAEKIEIELKRLG